MNIKILFSKPIKITQKKINQESKLFEDRKYVSSLINNINQTSQATRPKVVGKLSDIFQDFKKSNNPETLKAWKKYHQFKIPKAIDNAVDKIIKYLPNYKKAMQSILEKDIKAYIENLVFEKTFLGFSAQHNLINHLRKNGYCVKTASSKEESKNIDFWIEKIPFSLKPISYKNNINTKKINIKHNMVYWKKDKNKDFIFEFVKK